MSELDALRGRARALVDRHDQLLRELDRLESDLAGGEPAPVPTGALEDPLVLVELARLERAVALARRRQLVRLMPFRGRRAYVLHVVARLRGRGAGAPPGPPADLAVAQASPTAQGIEASLGEQLGRLVVLRSELARAEQDVLVPYRSLVKRAVRRRRDRRRGAAAAKASAGAASTAPRVSVLTAVYDTPPQLLSAQLRSVARQTLADLEHVLVNDGSPAAHVRGQLDAALAADRRRVVVHRDRNGGIVAASADALAAARGEYVALVDHDDLVEPVALERMVAALDARPDAVMAYSDHDILTASGRPFDPFHKPDFSPERLRGQNYITHFFVARRSAVVAVGGFREGFDGAQDHDLALRLGEFGPVLHVPGVLYHWRQAPDSVATDAAAKPYAYEAGRRAVEEHCARVGVVGEVRHGSLLGTYEVLRRPAAVSLVSVVIPTRGGHGMVWGHERDFVVDAVASIAERSEYPAVEFVVVADRPTPQRVLDRLHEVGGDRLRVVMFDEPFNFSRKCNVGAAASAGEVLLFLNDDTELVAPGSIGQMVGHLEEHDLGMVGAKLLFADGRLQHAGHVYPGGPVHALFGWPSSTVGPHRMAVVARECSGVTAAAAAMRRDVFDAVGGFDEAFPVNFNDVDLCLRVRRTGYRIVWTPAAEWYHFESVTRVAGQTQEELDLLFGRWRHELEHDPYFNECLLPGRNDWLPRPLLGGVSADTLGGH
jgi:GT2 family glycosyltransferase